MTVTLLFPANDATDVGVGTNFRYNVDYTVYWARLSLNGVIVDTYGYIGGKTGDIWFNPTDDLDYSTSYDWFIEASDDPNNPPAEGSWTASSTWSFTTEDAPPSKPINPTPSDGAVDADFSNKELSWEDGGNTDVFDVYIGSSSGNLSLKQASQTETSCVLETADTQDTGAHVYWRVDATNSQGTTTGDEWDFTVYLEPPANPLPSDNSGELVTGSWPVDPNTTILSWDAPSAFGV